MKISQTLCEILQSCQCDTGYTIRFSADSILPVCTVRPGALGSRAIVGIALGAFFVLALMVLAAICMFVCFWQRLEAYAWKRAKLRGPPGRGFPSDPNETPDSVA